MQLAVVNSYGGRLSIIGDTYEYGITSGGRGKGTRVVIRKHLAHMIWGTLIKLAYVRGRFSKGDVIRHDTGMGRD